MPMQDFPRAIVEHHLDPLDLGSRQMSEPRALGEELPQQAVGVLICPPLPGRMRMGKVHLHLGLFGEEPRLSHFGALVVRQRATKLRGQGPQFAGEGPSNRERIFGFQRHQQRKAGGAFYERTERRGIGMAQYHDLGSDMSIDLFAPHGRDRSGNRIPFRSGLGLFVDFPARKYKDGWMAPEYSCEDFRSFDSKIDAVGLDGGNCGLWDLGQPGSLALSEPLQFADDPDRFSNRHADLWLCRTIIFVLHDCLRSSWVVRSTTNIVTFLPHSVLRVTAAVRLRLGLCRFSCRH